MVEEKKQVSYESPLSSTDCGAVLLTHNDVSVISNGFGVSSCDGGRNLDNDGYSYGIKWQCVEFVRRYYKDHLNHSMPNKYGNAVDYFRQGIPHGGRNTERDLIQYYNGKTEKPKPDDLLVCPNMAGGLGHVAIIKSVTESEVHIIQQNSFPSIRAIPLSNSEERWTIEEDCIGFLRKE